MRHRWLHPDDRYKLRMWLISRKRGYQTSVDPATGSITLHMDAIIHGARHVLKLTITYAEQHAHRFEWRELVATRLREMRDAFRQVREETIH